MEDAYREVLSEFLARDRNGLRDAPTLLAPVVRSLVNRLAGDLVKAGMADEVASQTFLLLLLPTARRFNPDHGSSTDYLYGVVLRAAAEVRVQNGAAGIAKHERRLRLVRDQQHDEQADCHRRQPPYEDAAEAICLKVDVERALKSAPPELRAAMALIGAQDLSMSEAAIVARLDRNTLRRRLRVWATTAGLSA